MAVLPIMSPDATFLEVTQNALAVGTYSYAQNSNVILDAPLKCCRLLMNNTNYLMFGTSGGTTITRAVLQWSSPSYNDVRTWDLNTVADNVASRRISGAQASQAELSDLSPSFTDINSALSYLGSAVVYSITYRLTNATATGPNEATVGDTVTVPLTFTEGYGVVNPSTDAYVTCNGVLVPSTYSNGQLVFIMPDPS